MRKPQKLYSTDQVIELMQSMTLPRGCCHDCTMISSLMVKTATEALDKQRPTEKQWKRGELVFWSIIISLSVLILILIFIARFCHGQEQA